MIFTLKQNYAGQWCNHDRTLTLCRDVLEKLGCEDGNSYRLIVRTSEKKGFTKIRLHQGFIVDYFFTIDGVDVYLNCFGNTKTYGLISKLLEYKKCGNLYFKFFKIKS